MSQKQFDILVLSNQKLEPQIEDEALGWYYAEDFSAVIDTLDAEWTILASPKVCISRELLNSIADLCVDFPYADAFAPRIISLQKETVSSGFLLQKKRGLIEEFHINEKKEMRKVASVSPLLGIYSSRLLKALGGFDSEFQTDLKFFDLGLRAQHLGANFFSVPWIQAELFDSDSPAKFNRKELARIYYKDLDIFQFLQFTLRHPSTLTAIFKNKKELDQKSLAATEISKFTEEKKNELSV